MRTRPFIVRVSLSLSLSLFFFLSSTTDSSSGNSSASMRSSRTCKSAPTSKPNICAENAETIRGIKQHKCGTKCVPNSNPGNCKYNAEQCCFSRYPIAQNLWKICGHICAIFETSHCGKNTYTYADNNSENVRKIRKCRKYAETVRNISGNSAEMRNICGTSAKNTINHGFYRPTLLRCKGNAEHIRKIQ
jgi:hypothetical protein